MVWGKCEGCACVCVCDWWRMGKLQVFSSRCPQDQSSLTPPSYTKSLLVLDVITPSTLGILAPPSSLSLSPYSFFVMRTFFFIYNYARLVTLKLLQITLLEIPPSGVAAHWNRKWWHWNLHKSDPKHQWARPHCWTKNNNKDLLVLFAIRNSSSKVYPDPNHYY